MARFDFDELFDDDYLHFYRPFLDDDVTDDEAELVAELAEIGEGTRVLDLACGHGRIANRLAGFGADVVGIDRCETFLDKARSDATARGVEVEFRSGDMRALDARSEFDVVVSWFTSFGYHDDDTCRDILRRIHAALRPGGRLLIETLNRDLGLLTMEERPTIKEVDGEFMIDLARFDPLDGRLHVRRFVTRNGERIRAMRYFIRLFTFTELREWLRDAGFGLVSGYGGEGEVYRLDSSRMVVVAHQ
ncbi:MAG: methyltransferase domain-containing protein [Planctomycetes bacterium]|nr:methyltransferase domain-containing protein [Planctomycetota bacterium]